MKKASWRRGGARPPSSSSIAYLHLVPKDLEGAISLRLFSAHAPGLQVHFEASCRPLPGRAPRAGGSVTRRLDTSFESGDVQDVPRRESNGRTSRGSRPDAKVRRELAFIRGMKRGPRSTSGPIFSASRARGTARRGFGASFDKLIALRQPGGIQLRDPEAPPRDPDHPPRAPGRNWSQPATALRGA